MVSKIDLIPEEEFRQLIQESSSYNNFLQRIGMSHGRSSNDIVKRRCEQLNISTSHFKSMNLNKHNGNNKTPMEEILIENSTYKNTSRLKERLINEHYLEYKCACCGNTGEWLNKPLILQLDHINGNHQDNRIENLRLLCPNCHTQTETYGSKRGAKSKE